MKKFSLVLFYLCLNSANVFAQTEWSTTVASIFYNNCTVCHHDGGIAPFSLIDYDGAVTNAFSIQADVNAKKMPPWPADPTYSHFWDERVLSDADITSINDWVNEGMPSGDLSLAPPPPVYNGAPTMVNPDDTIELPAFTLTSDSNIYRTFVLHSNYSETKYINSYEFIPGDWSLVHHAGFQYDTSDVPYLLDLADTLPGYDSNPFSDPTSSTVEFGGWLPGNGISKLLPNMGTPILPNADFVITIHYSPGNMGKTDSSRLYLKFCTLPDSLIRPVYKQLWLYTTPPCLVNGPFQIPANEVKTFNEVSVPTSHKSMLGLIPHSHHVCKSWEVRMVNSQGDTTNLINIPQWSFYWQYSYMLTKVIEIPLGSMMLGEATFDNTENNPDNPNFPPLDIHEGGHSDQEMMRCAFWIMSYRPGDEDIILDSGFYGFPTSEAALAGKLALQIYPNPASTIIHLVSDLPTHDVNWQLSDLFGNRVKEMNLKNVANGIYVQDVDVSQLPSGIYQLSIQSGGRTEVKKLIVVK